MQDLDIRYEEMRIIFDTVTVLDITAALKARWDNNEDPVRKGEELYKVLDAKLEGVGIAMDNVKAEACRRLRRLRNGGERSE